MVKEFIIKRKIFFLIGFLFILIAPIYLLAADPIGDFHPIPKASSSAVVLKMTARNGEAYRIVNYSSASFFLPNKTVQEFDNFIFNSPRYTFNSTCGDGTCNPLTENNDPNHDDYCFDDCVNVKGVYKFCGDGVCSAKNSCDAYTAFGKFISCDAIPSVGENYFNCPQDCVEPFQNELCGPCGTYYDVFNAQYRVCPNQCNNNEASLTNCVKQEISVLADYSYGGSINSIYSKFSDYVFQENTIPNPGLWACDPELANACPAGSYCPASGTTDSTIVSCPAGYYCPEGTMRPQICPPRTYSAAGSATCTNCPNNTFSAPGAIAASGLDGCYALGVCGDGVCSNLPPYNENPRNCPADCATPNDGLCTGLENSVSAPGDCFCGDGQCNNRETSAACFVDCHCGNNGSGNGICEFEQGETPQNCAADCNLANTCGNGIREPYETSTNCPADSSCGDGFCNDFIGENYSNCPADCDECGNDICGSGESSYNCPIDCPRCGNGSCQTNSMTFLMEDGFPGLLFPAENSSNCSADCGCPDGICDAYELDTGSCPSDCGCGNGTCQTAAGETAANCAYDCGTCGDGNCAYHGQKIETSYSGADLNYYYYCPGDCDSGVETRLPILETGQ